MTYGFKIVEELISGLSQWMDEGGHESVASIVGRAVPNIRDWQDLNLNYVTKAVINQDACIKCGRCFEVCEDTSHQAIFDVIDGARGFKVNDAECVACNLCVNVCPVDNCITMTELPLGEVDPRTGKKVTTYANWQSHPNNPATSAAQ